LEIGNIKPERIIAGIKKKKVSIIACCWVLDKVEMKSPIPIVVRRYTPTHKSKKRKSPLIKGILNQRIATRVSRIVFSRSGCDSHPTIKILSF
jgi:hypothetical protein